MTCKDLAEGCNNADATFTSHQTSNIEFSSNYLVSKKNTDLYGVNALTATGPSQQAHFNR